MNKASNLGVFTAASQMKKQSIGLVVKRIGLLLAPYWLFSEEKWASWALVIINLFMTVLTNFFLLRYVIWNTDWTNLLIAKDVLMWKQNIAVFLLLGLSMAFAMMFNAYITTWVQTRWKRWLTARYLRLWMEKKAHYKLTLTGNETDNPDQRITEDINLFIINAWTYTFGFVSNIISLATYIVVLWGYSNIALVVGKQHLEFPGYLVVMSLLWAAITTLVAHLNGKRLARLAYNQQMYDANFRYSLVRVRENSEQIALLRGEAVEHSNLMRVFGDSVLNTFRTMAVNLRFGVVNTMLGYVDAMMFTLVLGPAWLWIPDGGITDYGTFMLIATAFLNVVTGFKWFQTNYVGLAPFIAVIDRLYAFNDNYDRMIKMTETTELKRTFSKEDEISIKDLEIFLPDTRMPDGTIIPGRLQITAKSIDIRPGEKVLIKGRTGAGKTTLFRAMSGIWPMAKGSITLPEGKKVIVLPQRPYFPIGTLEEAVSYPSPAGTYSPEAIKEAIIAVGLPQFADRLNEIQHWNVVLSGGEQQRVGIARALLYKPDYVFFDEATASMDEPSELEIYTMLLDKMKDTTIISIGHRSSLQQFHDRLLFAEGAVPGQPVAPYHFESQDIEMATQYFQEEEAAEEAAKKEK